MMVRFVWVISHFGHKPSRRQSNRRQTNWATRVGQLGDNLCRFSVCFVLIEQNKLSKKAVLSQGNHAMLLLISNMGYYLKQAAGWPCKLHDTGSSP